MGSSSYCYAELGTAVILKIAHIDTGKDFRGGQDLLLSLARGLKRRGHYQVIVCPKGSPLAQRAANEDQEVMRVGSIRTLRDRLRNQRFDIVHAHDGKAQTISFRASLGLPVRRVASRLVAFTPRHPMIHRWKYSLTCHGVIALSQSVRQVLVAAGVPDSHIEVIEPGIEMPIQFPGAQGRAEKRREARARWGFSSDEFVIGHIGAFTHEKGQDVALGAAILLASKLPRARMLLAGDGPERLQPEMIALARQASGIAQLPGFVDDLDEFYAGLDLFIMPSRSEAWGLTALRAMAFGLPVIASNVGGLPEVVEQGKSGWLVPSESPEALAGAIVDAASDPARLCEFGRNAQARAEQFSIERTVERTEQFYLRLLAAAGKETIKSSARIRT
ncbi:MAG: glycosyltransferase family 4 protein [Bryobacteraceae bacterium]